MLESIFTASSYDQLDSLHFIFMDVVFKKDFGFWKEGITYSYIELDLERGLMQEIDKDGKLTIDCRTCKITICPAE